MRSRVLIAILCAVVVLQLPTLTDATVLSRCRREVAEHCFESNSSPLKCLTDARSKLRAGECREWVLARHSCFAAVKRQGKCDPAVDTKLTCVRKVHVDELPKQCTSSEFYSWVKKDT